MSEQEAEADTTPGDSVEPLHVDVHPPPYADRHARLVLSGALTGRTAALAREALHTAVGTSGPWLVLDIDRLTRLDRHGLAVLVAALHLVRRTADDGCLHLLGDARSPSARALASSGLWRAVPLSTTAPTTCA